MDGALRQRKRYIHFRASAAEHAALEKLARLEQTGISETMRSMLRKTAQERGVWPIQEPRQTAEVAQ